MSFWNTVVGKIVKSPVDVLTGKSDQFHANPFLNDFQAQQAPLQHADFANALLEARQGSTQARGSQDQLIQALQAQSAGQGPSLAQMQLQQATDQNQAMAAGQMASQRGLNPALAARLIGQNRAAMQQGAAGQSGMLRLQEQMSARQQLAQAIAMQRGQDLSMYGQSAQGLQGQNALDLQNLQQQQALNQMTSAQNQGARMGAQAMNAGISAANANARNQLMGGILGGAGAFASHFSQGKAPGAGGAPGPEGLMSPTEAGAGESAAGAMPTMAAIPASHGAVVPGQAPVAGDSPSNDTVPAQLSPGEIVLPRSVTQSEEAPELAAKFVAAIKKSKQKPLSYGEVLAKHRELQGRVDRLEAMFCGGQVR